MVMKRFQPMKATLALSPLFFLFMLHIPIILGSASGSYHLQKDTIRKGGGSLSSGGLKSGSDAMSSLLSPSRKSGRKKRRRKSKRSSNNNISDKSNIFTGMGMNMAKNQPPPKPTGLAAPLTPVETIEKPVVPKAEKSTNENEAKENKGHEKMPTLFSNTEDLIYDQYAACLAATEGLRRARDAVLKQKRKRSAVNVDAVSGNPLKSFFGGTRSDCGAKQLNEDQKEAYKRACAQYVLQSGKVIRSLGLTVSQFNQLGREVGRDGILKERVMEQAYLYRMAATVNMAKIPLIEDPNSKQLLKSHRRRRVQMFARSVTDIEDLRAEQTKRLKRALNVDVLPPGIKLSDPNVLPILNQKVRAVVTAFPLQAEEIVKKYGLNSDEFNEMLEETRENPIFRWRVKKYMKNHDDLVKGLDAKGSL